MAKLKLKKQKGKVDNKLLVLTIVLMTIGLIAVADASAPQALNFFNDKLYFFKQQAVWAVLGVAALLVSSRINYTFWEKIATPAFIASLLLLAAVLIPGVGSKALGARRWFNFGPVSIQPSEIVKLTLALYFAKVAASNKKALSYFVPLGLVFLLIMLQPDFGTGLIIGTIGMVQMFVAGVSILHFIGGVVFALVSGFILVLTSPYRRERLMTYLHSSQDPLDKSYHIRQILLALGSGGLLGVGLGQSRQKFLFLPEAATDSIFAVIAEEIGFIWASGIIFLFIWFILRGLRIAKNAPDKFSQVLAVGIIAWIGGQAILNLASMVALVPLTGIPLPFISYGGSALTMNLFSTGILLNISRYAKAK